LELRGHPKKKTSKRGGSKNLPLKGGKSRKTRKTKEKKVVRAKRVSKNIWKKKKEGEVGKKRGVSGVSTTHETLVGGGG